MNKKQPCTADLDAIAEAVESENPKNEANHKLRDMAEYAAMYAGGEKRRYLDDLDKFAKQLHSRNEVAAQQWKLLSGTKLSEVPEYVTALVKALLCCPPHPSYVVGGEAKLWN